MLRAALAALCFSALAGITPATRAADFAELARQDAAYARWRTSLDAFAAADREQAPAPGGVVFIGSSSIRLWDGLESQFETSAGVVIKRGFGGSRLSDCASLVSRLVVPHRPRLVVVYAGDNDLADGARPQDVADSFSRLVRDVRAALPDTRIAYVSIKPSPSRAHLLPQMQAANALVAQLAAGTENLDYIDVHTPMLGPDGQPRADLFRADGLHLNAAGYALWRDVIARHVAPAATPVTAAARSTAATSSPPPTPNVHPAPR